MKTLNQKDICNPIFIAPLSTIAKIWKQPKAVHQWMNGSKNIHIHPHTQMEYYSDTHTHTQTHHFWQYGWTLKYYSKWNKSDR